MTRYEVSGLPTKLRQIMNEVSTNRLSMWQSFKMAILSDTSTFYKACYIAALLAALCAVVAQGSIVLISQPVYADQHLTIPYVGYDTTVDTPWSANNILGPYNAGKVAEGVLGTSWVYLEHVIGATLEDSLPAGYLVPVRGSSNNSYGSQYPTDVIHVQCDCQWVAPTLPEAVSNASYISVALGSLDMMGIQGVPYGIASKYLKFVLEDQLMTPT